MFGYENNLKRSDEWLLNYFMTTYYFLSPEDIKRIRDIYFNTYSRNVKNWNLKIRPGMDWYLEEVRKLIQKQKGYSFNGQYDSSI